MQATGIVRRIDDLGRVVIPKEIRWTLRIREGDPPHTTLTLFDKFCLSIHSVVKKIKARWNLSEPQSLDKINIKFLANEFGIVPDSFLLY